MIEAFNTATERERERERDARVEHREAYVSGWAYLVHPWNHKPPHTIAAMMYPRSCQQEATQHIVRPCEPNPIKRLAIRTSSNTTPRIASLTFFMICCCCRCTARGIGGINTSSSCSSE